MEMRVADGVDGDLLIRPGRLAGVAIEIAEKFDETILAEIGFQIIGERIVIALICGGIVCRVAFTLRARAA
jgi:hypothetical protein